MATKAKKPVAKNLTEGQARRVKTLAAIHAKFGKLQLPKIAEYVSKVEGETVKPASLSSSTSAIRAIYKGLGKAIPEYLKLGDGTRGPRVSRVSLDNLDSVDMSDLDLSALDESGDESGDDSAESGDDSAAA